MGPINKRPKTIVGRHVVVNVGNQCEEELMQMENQNLFQKKCSRFRLHQS